MNDEQWPPIEDNDTTLEILASIASIAFVISMTIYILI